ncbi:MAG: hypothetical protein K8H88_20745 [Sandaracinaceae bacterium]|nr:hypothetical protein [Sandaracinaceae bacterium]
MRAVLLTLTLLLLPAAAHAQLDHWHLDEHMTPEGRAERAQSVIERGPHRAVRDQRIALLGIRDTHLSRA